jgi:hypothetical protein
MHDLPNHRQSPYTMMQMSDNAARCYTPLPYSVLAGEEYVPSVGGIKHGTSHLDRKLDRYRTSQGVLTLEEYNRRARAFTPESCSPEYRFLCETWLKYNHDSPLAQELYRLDQRESRTMHDRGTGVGSPD